MLWKHTHGMTNKIMDTEHFINLWLDSTRAYYTQIDRFFFPDWSIESDYSLNNLPQDSDLSLFVSYGSCYLVIPPYPVQQDK